MLFPTFFSYFLVFAKAQEKVGSLLLYEDQKPEIPNALSKHMNFLTLKKEIHKETKHFKDVTFCYRFNFLSFIAKTKGSTMFVAHTPYYVEIVNPISGAKWNTTNRLQSHMSPLYHVSAILLPFAPHLLEVIEASGMYYTNAVYKESIRANQWHSVCYGFDVKSRDYYMVHNGMTSVNITQPEIWAEVNMGFDTSIVRPFTTKYPLERGEAVWHKDLNAAQWSGIMLGRNIGGPYSGYITDLQIYGHSLTAEEMHDITTCKAFPKGDIYSWDPDHWEPWDKELQKNDDTAVQFRKVDIIKNTLCDAGQKYTFFPDRYTLEGGLNVCRRFGGVFGDVSTSKKYDAIVDFLGKSVKENPKFDDSIYISTYTMYNDEEEYNVWRHAETGKLPEDPLIWNSGEPNGDMVENCAELRFAGKSEDGTKFVGGFNDYRCDNKIPVLCEGIGDVVVRFRGICKFSLIDTTYTMLDGDINGKRFFGGNTGWKIYWDDASEYWKLSSPKQENMFGAHAEFATYPVGKNYWKIVNDSRCIYPDPDKVLINLSPCDETSFTCDDGTCVPMEVRCDQTSDCEDSSDEKGCEIVVIDPNNYLKDKPPKNAMVKINVELLKVLELDEVAMLFRTKYTVNLEWLDSRITFHNLHKNQGLNTLVESEKQNIWTPRLIFHNTDESTRTTTDSESVISVRREGNYTTSTIETIDNTYIFLGSENPLVMSRIYQTEWICDYEMNWFPFDTQKCQMTFAATKDMNPFIQIIGNGHNYRGPVELTQYFIRETEMFPQRLDDDQQAMVFQTTLGRRLLGNLLTIFLPTLLLNVIGHSTNYFKAFFFEAVVSVNLTVMLVLTTMFINVSNQLPKTSYIKMIDVWLLFNLFLPFTEVLLHTYKDYLRSEEREVNHHGRVRKLGDDQTDDDVLRNNWVGGNEQLQLDLISRQEDVQVAALKVHYDNLTPDERKLARADFIGFRVIPVFAMGFVVAYWTMGMMKYYSPDWSAYTFLLPAFQADSTVQEMMDATLDHVKSFFDSNSTLRKTLEQAGTNLTSLITQTIQNSSAVQTWNQTLQDTISTF